MMAVAKPSLPSRSILVRRDYIRLSMFGVMMLVVVPIIALQTPLFKNADWTPNLTVQTLKAAPLATRIHAAAVLTLLLAGGVILALPKGDRRHRLLGRGWMIAMSVMAAASLAVPHGQSVAAAYAGGGSALALMGYGYWAIRRRRMRDHARAMVILIIALVFMTMLALTPGRLMHQVVFGS